MPPTYDKIKIVSEVTVAIGCDTPLDFNVPPEFPKLENQDCLKLQVLLSQQRRMHDVFLSPPI